MKKSYSFILSLILLSCCSYPRLSAQSRQILLSGEWSFRADPMDIGIGSEWYQQQFSEKIILPGSMTTNNKGNDIDVNTPWTGSIFDSSWFIKPEYAKYREPGNIKVPFWLQPIKYYKGAAWYQKTVTIPAAWKNEYIELFIERSHWETTVWIDNRKVGMANSLATPHVFDLSGYMSPGERRITVRVDNWVKDFNVGQNAHSISDHTQSNWNGMVGNLSLISKPKLFIEDVQLFPNIHKKEVVARLSINNTTGKVQKTDVRLSAVADKKNAEILNPLQESFKLRKGLNTLELVYPMGTHPLLWDEFNPNLYSLTVTVEGKSSADVQTVSFGMREFMSEGTRFAINGRPAFLRGTLECAIFPKTGYPPTDIDSWMEIFRMAKYYGLNHMRFHSWCPPEAAFDAADRSGFYLQVEASTWPNQGSAVGDGDPIDKYLYEETSRILKSYGNHPSFCMLASGNEPDGKNQKEFLTQYVNYWKAKDSRRLYTTAAGWPVVPESDYNSTAEPRIQGWGQGIHSIINAQPPRTNFDWSEIISKWKQPTVSHEIGQWCVYPDFKEMQQYTGVLHAKNFEIFQQMAKEHGILHLADSFLLASGKLQTLCYKADIEAALRTKGFAGFQLLDIHDFPGQGTALVGVLNPFWKEKGYVTGAEYSRFCNTTVPLARFSKMIFRQNEILTVPVEVAHFGEMPLENIVPVWNISNAKGEIMYEGQFASITIPIGNGFFLGEIRQSLSNINHAQQLTLTVSTGNFRNSWDFFVYPSATPSDHDDILITQQLDSKAIEQLKDGGKVLLTLKKGSVAKNKGGAVAVGFSSIFWNTAWTGGQPPHTLGILCDPHHPALKEFPTQYHSNWQWWDAMSHADAVMLDSVANGLQPIVRVIDDWATNRSLGLIFEVKTGNGKLILSSIDLLDDKQNRPEARQLLYSLSDYMHSEAFNPTVEVDITKIKNLFLQP
ncbi:MAG: beta-galactosidase [Chitinophagaceae bacterium]|nr:beta-galactosidase [Chitinophagaceae bacterium]